jgi:hypothetical protein
MGRIQPILEYPTQLRGFLGISGFCHLWIPGHGELAKPLYGAVGETQKAKISFVSWGPELQPAFD